MRVEFLTGTKQASPTAALMLAALIEAASNDPDVTSIMDSPHYTGMGDVLVLYGVGAPDRAEARRRHVRSGRRVILWDLGYFGREKLTGHLRCSIDHDHPQALLDATPPDPSRWWRLGIPLREDADPNGPILLIGLGRKSRSYLNEPDWEANKLAEIRQRYPGRRIIYRPKPGHPSPHLKLETDDHTPIDQILRGASLVVCRHSNVAVDGIVAGVPFDAEDGAATWLNGKPFTPQNRLDFLNRLAWWQWRTAEAPDAWRFLMEMIR
jgi:hypothetical protein